MKFNVSGTEYDIRFKYVKNESGQVETKCKISRVNPDLVGSERYSVVVTGNAMQSVRDRFNKQTGRKVALTRAANAFSNDKADRKAVWDAYLSTCPVK